MVYTFAAGEQPTADNLNAIFDQTMTRKAAIESVTSSTAIQNDDDFSWSLAAGTYLVFVWLHLNGLEAGDFKCAWANTGTMTIARSSFGPAAATTDRESTLMVTRGNTSTTEQTYGVDTTGSTVVKEELLVIVDVAGTLTLRWAQGTSSGTATSVTTASRAWVVSVA